MQTIDNRGAAMSFSRIATGLFSMGFVRKVKNFVLGSLPYVLFSFTRFEYSKIDENRRGESLFSNYLLNRLRKSLRIEKLV